MKSRLKALCLLLAAALLAGGCASSYHFGTALPPEQRCIFVQPVVNKTPEAFWGRRCATPSRNGSRRRLVCDWRNLAAAMPA